MNKNTRVKSQIIPTVIERGKYGPSGVYDIYSRLLEDRIIFLSGAINDSSANTIIAQMLFLESKNPKKDIKLYINSPGGMVTAGLAIYDTIQFVKCDVSTICVGMAASMGAVILASGTKGKRFILPNSEVMLHQVMGGVQGQATDVEISARHIIKIKSQINKILSNHTKQKLEKIEQDTDRDFYLGAKESKEYGLVDKIIS